MEKVTIKYDQGKRKDEVVTFEIPEQEFEQMIKNDYQNRLANATNGEIVERRTVQEIFDGMSRMDYNSWQTHKRNTLSFHNVESETDEPNLFDFPDYSQIEEIKKQEDYEEQCQVLRNSLSPKQADLMIAIVLDDVTLVEYAMKTGEEYNNVFRRYKRAEQALKEKWVENGN